jgi:isopentenyl diphosphate isomerase/L-lactate dehydrogenase-like FMN-dependent dehydrogenase
MASKRSPPKKPHHHDNGPGIRYDYRRGQIRDRCRSLGRAAAAKCSVLMLTVDLQVLGQRHCDVKNGLVPPAFCDGGARPHAVRPRSARTSQISKHAPMNPAIR